MYMPIWHDIQNLNVNQKTSPASTRLNGKIVAHIIPSDITSRTK
jgi:hypothetical protein